MGLLKGAATCKLWFKTRSNPLKKKKKQHKFINFSAECTLHRAKWKRLFKDAVINIAVEEKASAAAAVYYSVSSVQMWTKPRFRFLFKQRSLPKFAGKNSTGTQCDLSAGTTHLQIMRLIIYSTEMICPALTSAAERVEDVNSGGHWIMIPRGTGEFTVKKKEKKIQSLEWKALDLVELRRGERFLNVT